MNSLLPLKEKQTPGTEKFLPRLFFGDDSGRVNWPHSLDYSPRETAFPGFCPTDPHTINHHDMLVCMCVFGVAEQDSGHCFQVKIFNRNRE